MDFSTQDKLYGIPVVQNQQEFLVGVFPIKRLLRFTRYTRRILIGLDEEGMPIYNPEIQREVENARVQKIADFLIDDPEATFPTNIVLHIPSQIILEQKKLEDWRVELTLNSEVYKGVEKDRLEEGAGNIYITIIDGQHRIRGIEVAIQRLEARIDALQKTLKGRKNIELEQKLKRDQERLRDLLKIEVMVSFFIDKALEYQAMIFSTINRTQKKVSESLVYSLFGLNTKDSPQKTALQVALALNGHQNSPFFGRLKLYGGSYARNQSPPLTQAMMVKSILELISENAREAEADRWRPRKELQQRTKQGKYLPFRQYYVEDRDNIISDILFRYFTAVRNVFLGADGTHLWDFDPESTEPSNVLQTTVGYQALLRILVDMLRSLKEDERVKSAAYEVLLRKALPSVNVQDTQRYPFTSKSRTLFYLDISLAIWPPEGAADTRLVKRSEALKEM
jgi:DGQHR domain-containing protein